MKQLLLMLLLAPCLLFAQGQDKYVCPPCGPCDTIIFHKPGKCPHCGMELIKKDTIEKRMSVCFLLYDGIEILDFAGPLEVFADAGFEVFTVAKEKKPIISQGVLKVLPDYSLADAPQADMLAVFGGNAGPTAEDPDVMAWIKSRDKNTARYFSVCTGAFILGNAGLLDNQTATTYHEQIGNLRKKLPRTKVLDNVRYVDNGRIITTAGISAGIDGALHIVAKLKGEAEALRVARVMEYDKYVPNQGLTINK